MKKITTILVILISMQSQAVHLSEDGIGQVLLFPYYTVNGGFNTLITVTNNANQAKALRLRFREAANAREVLGINLYLGPNDVWTGALIADHSNNETTPKLISNDQSCTQPLMPSGGMLFSKSEFSGDFSDIYGTDNTRMAEGFVEVFEMGVLTGDSALATILYSGGVPTSTDGTDCTKLINAWDTSGNDNYWINDPTIDMLPPTGSISGDITLIDVQQGISVNQSPTVLADFSDEILHFSNDNESPSLADAKSSSLVKDNLGNIHEMTWARGIDAVSSVLMATNISNEYTINPSIGAATDWVITMPTRQYYRDPRYTPADISSTPFSQQQNELSYDCEAFIPTSWDQDGATTSWTGAPPPASQQLNHFCYASNSYHVSPAAAGESTSTLPTGLFSSHHPNGPHLRNDQLYGFNGTTAFDDGWINLSLYLSPLSDTNGIEIKGLPVIGFSTQQFINDNAQQNIKANYANLSTHKRTVEITNTSSTAKTGMHISENSLGQVLIYPYYTVRNEFFSLITVVNTSDEVKALKVVFKEGRNARNVFDLVPKMYGPQYSYLLNQTHLII